MATTPRRPVPVAEEATAPEVTTASMIGVEHNLLTHGLDLTVYARDETDGRVKFRVTVPADLIPDFMRAVVQSGGYAMKDIADAWRRGDCSTCGNRRLVDVTRPNGHKTNTYCPDCSGPEGTRALEGFPVLRRVGGAVEG